MYRIFVFLSCLAICHAQQPVQSIKDFVRVPGGVIALEHVRIMDGAGAPAQAHQTIVISNGKITTIGPASSIEVPSEAKRMDFTGYTALPGLVGMHDHLFFLTSEGVYRDMPATYPRLYLAAGVTTIRTTGSMEPYTDLEIKKAIDSGKMLGPKMNVTGPYLDGEGFGDIHLHVLTGPEDARRTVEYWAAEGVGSFKVYAYLSRAELKAVIKAAHKHKVKVTGHLCSIGFREAAELGIDNLEHGLIVDTEFFPGKRPDACPSVWGAAAAMAKLDASSPEVQATIKSLVAHHVAVTSTLPVFEQWVPSRPDIQQRTLAVLSSDARKEYSSLRADMAKLKNSPWPLAFQKEMQFERAFVAAGGHLMAGPDAVGVGGLVAGFGDQREIELLVEAGFTPLEAIKIATLNGAQFLGEADHVGSLAPGKQADIVLVKGDPSTKIADIENVELVFKDGVGYDSKKLIDSVKGEVGLH